MSTSSSNRRASLHRARALALLAGIAAAICPALQANAETGEVRLAYQYGIPYLPLLVMKKNRLIEQRIAKAGLPAVKVTWAQFGSGEAMNTALLAGSLDFAAGGVAPLLKIWDKSKGQFDVKGAASLGSMPMFLNANDPRLKSLRDFHTGDRIALPAVKVSIQALVLEMAAAKAFGEQNFAQLDADTVSMKHPDAMAALLAQGTEIKAHFANPPFQELELENKSVHRVLSSYDVLGPSTLDSVYTTAQFHDTNPKIYGAVIAALQQAMQIINPNKQAAAQLYVEETHSKLGVALVRKILDDPDSVFTTTPKGIMKYARFMHRIGAIKNMPASWADVYFPEIHSEPGS